MKQLLLISGGIDSVSIAITHQPKFALIVDYGHKAFLGELASSKYFCTKNKISLHTIKLDLSSLGQGSLFSGAEDESDHFAFRNQFLLTVGCMKAVDLGCDELLIGAVRDDVNYSDCSSEFLQYFQSLVSIQAGGVAVRTPLIDYTSEKALKQTSILYPEALNTFSCHISPVPCGVCRGCKKRLGVLFSVYGTI